MKARPTTTANGIRRKYMGQAVAVAVVVVVVVEDSVFASLAVAELLLLMSFVLPSLLLLL